jgi:hypothetical protein
MAENTLEVRPAISFKAYVKEKNGFRPAQGLDLDIGEKVGMKDGKNPGFATITAIVRLKNDSQPRNFVLTAGHAFRDVDQNWYKLTDDNNYIGLRADGLPAVKLPIYWGPARSSEDPCAVSYLQYRCAGDKLGSTVDAGLALLKPNVKVSQAYGDGKTITAFDEWPSEDRPEGQQYMLGTEVIEGNWRDSFELVWPTWDKKKGGTLSRVYIRKVPEKPFSESYCPFLPFIQIHH